MQQLSLRQIIYIVIGFAIFFAMVTMALNGNQFCQIIALAAASLIPLMFVYACVFLFCKVFASAYSNSVSSAPASPIPNAVPPMTLPANPSAAPANQTSAASSQLPPVQDPRAEESETKNEESSE